MLKQRTMFAFMLGSWALCLLYFNPRLLALLIGPEPLLGKLGVIAFTFLLDLCWFYACYHLVIVGFSYGTPHHGDQLPLTAAGQPEVSPQVALLYTTCDDFQEKAARSHLDQDYDQYHLFILDDSCSPAYQVRVEAFAQAHADRVTVIRREDRRGFKAGNINHALRMIGREYAYFSISDADTELPPNYIRALLPYVSNPRIAFAQANQQAGPTQGTLFGQAMALSTDLHYQHYASTKNRFGFVMFYGHGALMRRDVWGRVGGFPEIVTEDLAYSMQARVLGYEGVFVPGIVCVEEFPATYRQYRKRNEKWIRGTIECLMNYYPAFMKAEQVAWFEKVDVLVSAASLLLAVPFMALLLLVGVLLPLAFSQFQFQGPMLRMPILHDHTFLALTTQLRSNLFWSWDVYLLMLVTVFAPLVPAVIDCGRQPLKMLRYLAAYMFHFFALQVVSTIHVLAFLLTKKAVFPVTGAAEPVSDPKATPRRRIQWLAQSHANHRGIWLVEAVCGLICWVIGSATQNLWCFPSALALWLSPLVSRWNLNMAAIRYAVFVPFLALLGIVYLIGRALPGL